MTKKAYTHRLGASLQAEEQSVKDRFAQADAYFAARDHVLSPALSAADSPREKVIRDGFSMPVQDYALIADLQEKSLQAGHAATKSEVLRGGLHALLRLSPDDLRTLLTSLEKMKPGRAAKKEQ